MTAASAVAGEKGKPTRVSLLRVLGPGHVWALGVGIVLVGEFTGWNFAADKGGALAALITCWFVGLLYTSVAMIDSEVTSTVAAAGGQYAQAKHIVGPLTSRGGLRPCRSPSTSSPRCTSSGRSRRRRA